MLPLKPLLSPTQSHKRTKWNTVPRFRWLIFQWSWPRPFEEPTMGSLCPTCSATYHCSPMGYRRWSKPPPASHCLCLPAVLALGLSNSRMITGKSIRSVYTLRFLVSLSNVQDYCFSVLWGQGKVVVIWSLSEPLSMRTSLFPHSFLGRWGNDF